MSRQKAGSRKLESPGENLKIGADESSTTRAPHRKNQILKAYGYCRVSDSSQRLGGGFARQEDVIGAYARRHGVELVEVFREDVSGTKDETARPVFQEMIAAILADGVRAVIVESLDRLARELRIQEELLVYLASREIDLISARTEECVTRAMRDDPLKKALIQIQGVFAELDRSQIALRLRRGRERKRREVPGYREGRPGYEDTPEGRAIVTKIRLLRRAPRRGRRLTWRQIASRLNAEGLRTLPDGKHPDGREWTLFRVAQVAAKRGGVK